MPHTISVGRGPSNDLVYNNGAVSTSHALITFAEDGTIIYTDNSTNGTMINGRLVHHRGVYIKPGDVITLPGNILVSWSAIGARNPYSPIRSTPTPPPTPSGDDYDGDGWGVPAEAEEEETKEPGFNVCGLIGFILSIIALPCYILAGAGLYIDIAALVLSIIGMCFKRRGLAIAGFVISLVPLAIILVCVIFAASLISEFM